MRWTLHRTAIFMAVAALTALTLPAPASAAPSVGPAVRAATNPAAVLTGASVTFKTNDEDKDSDTKVLVQVSVEGNPVPSAWIHEFFGHFDDDSVHGPYPLQVDQPSTAAELRNGVIWIRMWPRPGWDSLAHDTWRFNLDVTLSFSDGTTYVVQRNGIELSHTFFAFNLDLTIPFSVTSQAPVPDLEGRTSDAAATAIRNAGLTVGSVSSRVDPTCNNVRRVMSQQPSAGTVVDIGSTVSYTIGAKPKTPCK